MAISSEKTSEKIRQLLSDGSLESHLENIRPKLPEELPLKPEIPDTRSWSIESYEKRVRFLKDETGIELDAMGIPISHYNPEDLKGNIENFIGFSIIPTGIVGPVRVNGTNAQGDFYVPLSTTEGALVASYHRGAKATALAGGITSVLLTEGIQRAPSFIFSSFLDVGVFLIWVMGQREKYWEIIAKHSKHASLIDIRPNVDGNQLTLIFEYLSGDASGQNMVTICTDAICQFIVSESPVKPEFWTVEGNLSCDKKATSISFTHVRGKKVTSEVTLPSEIVEKFLHSDVHKMMEYWKLSAVNGVQSGSIGINGHFANGLTAIYIACGQDVATVAESATGTTRFNITKSGDLYVCVTLPNLVVGTVGGGTRFKTQQECLSVLGCNGTGTAAKFAEIVAATLLCGEISIIAALSAGDFTRAHRIYGRNNPK